MPVVFDGHNDALTVDDHAGLANGRVGGHLDLPRMQAGGVRGAIFAVFTPPEHEREQPLPWDDGVIEFELASPVSHPRAAAYAGAAAGRLVELERGAHLRIVRTIEDVDAAADGDGPRQPSCTRVLAAWWAH